MENTDNQNIENELPVQNEQINNQLPSLSSFFANFWTNKSAHQWIIFLFAFLLYSNTIGNKYAIDDVMVIQDNKYTRKGFNGMYGIWFFDTFNGFFGDQKNIVSGGRYRPFTVATFALENQLFGKVVKNRKDVSVLITYVQVEQTKKDALIKKLNSPKHNILNSKKTVVNKKEVELLTLGIEIAPGAFIPDQDGDIMYEGNPHISHTVNALLFALLCLVLYLWIYKMFDPRGTGSQKAFFIAFVSALLFAAHPLHTEAVANIKGRDEIAVTLFSVLACYWTMLSINSKRGLMYMSLALFAFLLALFSKESAIPFLLVIPAAIYFFMKEVKLSSIAYKTVPFFIAIIVFWFAVRNPILDTPEIADEPMDLINNPFLKVDNSSQNPVCVKFNDEEKYAMIMHTWFDYLKIMVIPYPLTSDYYPKHIGVSESDTKPSAGVNITELRDENGKVRYIRDNLPTFRSPVVILSIIIHLAMAILAFWGLRKRKAFAFALIFYAATFSVVSNLFFPIGTLMAERFLFMPSIAFSLCCSIVLSLISFDNIDSIKKNGLNISLTLIAISLLGYSYITFSRNFDWYDNASLFIKDIKVSVNSAKMNNDYANALLGIAQKSELPLNEKKEIAKKAIYFSANSINIYPLFSNAWVHHGNAYVTMGNFLEYEADSLRKLSSPDAKNYYNEVLKMYNHALQIYQKADRYSTDTSAIIENLAIIHRTKGNLFAKLERNLESISDFELANKYTYGKDIEVNRLLAAAYGIAAVNSLKLSNVEESEQFHKNCILAISRAEAVMPVHVMSTISNLEKANREMANENKEHEKIFLSRAEELAQKLKAIK
jgi:tetratricopeptide (TPR) repeat protein